MTTRLPPPPEALPSLEAEDLTTLSPGTLLVRLHRLGPPHPMPADGLRTCGPHPERGRFDPHPPGLGPREHPGCGVAYLATEDSTVTQSALPTVDGVFAPRNALDVAVAEMAQTARTLVVDDGLWLSVLELAAPLELLDIRSSWTQRTGAGLHLATAPHHRAQAWARAIREAYPLLPGLLYPPSTGGRGTAVVLWQPAARALEGAVLRLSRATNDSALRGVLASATERVGCDLVHP